MDIRSECIYLKGLTKEERKKYLKNNEFRKRLFATDGHYPFVWLVQDLEKEELLDLLDNDIIDFLKNDVRISDKLNAIITNGNPYNNKFLSKSKVLEMIQDNIEQLKYYLDELDMDFGESYFNYLINSKELYGIGYLNTNIQLEILKNIENLNKIKNQNPTYEFLLDLSKESIEYLLNDKYFENIFLNAPINSIAYLIKKKVTLPANLSNSNYLINKYLSINNLVILLEYLIDLEENNKYLKDRIKEKLLLKYINPYDIEESNLLDFIIILNYEEIPYNFLKNIECMLNFINQINKVIIPIERYIRYNKLYNFNNLSFEEKCNLYKELFDNKNAMGEFYDDYKACFNYSIMMLKDNCLDLKKEKIVNNNSGINVYELNGEKFNLLINHTYFKRNGNNEDLVWNDSKNFASLSLIGDSYLGTFKDPKENVIIGFKEFDPKNIVHIYHSDSASLKEFGSRKILELYTPDNLLKNTKFYNEILIKNSDNLKPSYVICYDEIKQGDIEASKCLGNIPIIIINTKKYNQEKTEIDLNDNNYMTYGEASIINRKGR